jgi:hypothetical protein
MWQWSPKPAKAGWQAKGGAFAPPTEVGGKTARLKPTISYGTPVERPAKVLWLNLLRHDDHPEVLWLNLLRHDDYRHVSQAGRVHQRLGLNVEVQG